MDQIKHIPLEKLKPPKFDNRLTDSPEEDDELMESIREVGILEPLIVKEVEDGYEIVIGNRRRTQAGRAGLRAAPCIVTKSTAAAAEKMKLHENIKRLPLSHIDQGYTFAHLMKVFNLTEKECSIMAGMSTAYVSQHLALIHSDKVLLDAVHDGRINFSVARELNRCKDADERERLQKVVENHGATQYVVRNWVDDSNRETSRIEGEAPPPPSPARPVETAPPMYPCGACEVPIDVMKIKTIRICPDCHYLIFTEIEKEKQRARMNLGKNAVPEAAD